MTPSIGGGRLGNDSLPVVQGHADHRGRGIKTHHKHADQPSGRPAWPSQSSGPGGHALVQGGFGGAVTDVATVIVRYHNVVVTVTLNALDHSNKGNYGPVSKTQLTAAAMAFARAAEASLH